MTTPATDRALLDLVALADSHDHMNIRVMLQSAGVKVIGQLMSEVAYRKSVTAVVRAGNAAPAAETYVAYEEIAEAKRQENERRMAGRPHTPVPEQPDALHILVEEDDGSDRVWRYRFEAIEGWSLLEFGIQLPPGD
ncbi:hypothetical protein AB0911_12420 [Streptomyces nigra]|uniref:hypothetical protein n=1 Tax=Streptomyces nigra TaxID=1827580 RepID=UPI003453C7D9